MQLVIYLSGNVNIVPSQDSVAASVKIPKSLEKELINALVDVGELDAYPEKGWRILCLGEGIDDLFSDIEDDEEHPLQPIAKDVRALIRCEASCGFIHLVKGEA